MTLYPQRPTLSELEAIVSGFSVSGPIGPIRPLGRGLINLTYRVRAGGRDWVLQRINGAVFAHPERIMGNLQVLDEYRGKAAQLGLRLPELVPGRDGEPFFRDAQGALWRLMELIAETRGLRRLASSHQARQVGSVLGRFHRFAADLPRDRLQVSVPDFHHTPRYLARLLEALALAEGVSAAERSTLDACLLRIDRRRGLTGVLEDARAEGRIREGVIHGDPKLDNILFDVAGQEALAMIDLDTVQPGLIQQDLGDCLRSCCNRMGESPGGQARPGFDVDLCAAILQGYAEQTRHLLEPSDIALVYDGIRLLPYELALRFLTDHLEGDRYFRVTYRGQNLEKARTQLDLLADIESQETAIRRIIADAFGGG